MTPEYKRKVWKWILFVVLPILYLCGFCFLSMADIVWSQTLRQSPRLLTTEGNSLYVGTSAPRKTFQQQFFYEPLYIDGQSATAWTEDGKLSIQVGEDVYERDNVGLDTWFWSPKNHCLFYLDQGDKSDPPNRHIWKWSKPKGFERMTSKPQAFYNLTVSLDGNSICAMVYDPREDSVNSVFSCSVNGGKEFRDKHDLSNFKPVMLSKGSYLLEVEDQEEVDKFDIPYSVVYRWSPGSEPTIFKVGNRAPRCVDAVGGSIWVLFQEQRYEWRPWMVGRGKDKVTVARLSDDLTKIVEEIPLRSEE